MGSSIRAPTSSTRTSRRSPRRSGSRACASKTRPRSKQSYARHSHPGPVVVDAVVNRMELAMPPWVTAEMAKGFTLYMLKAVMSGRGDEIVELARTNVRR